MVLKMLTKLDIGIEQNGENINIELESIIRNEAYLKNTITEIKIHYKQSTSH